MSAENGGGATGWRLQTGEGDVFGPVAFATLQDWAREGRVWPVHQVSEGDGPWVTAATVAGLGMVWRVQLVNGSWYGPVHTAVLAGLVQDGSVAADAALRNERTGQLTTVADYQAAADAKTAALDALQVENDALRERVAELEQAAVASLVATEEAQARARDEAEQRQAAETRADSAIAELQTGLEESLGSLEAVRKERDALARSLDEERDASRQAGEYAARRVEGIALDRARLQQRADELSAALEEATTLAERRRREGEDLARQAEGLGKECDALAAAKQEYEHQLQVAVEMARSAEQLALARGAELEQARTALRQQRDESERNAAALEQRHAAAAAEAHEEAQGRIAELEEHVDGLTERVTGLDASLRRREALQRDTLARWEQDRQTTGERMREIEEARRQATERLARAREEIEQLQTARSGRLAALEARAAREVRAWQQARQQKGKAIDMDHDAEQDVVRPRRT